MYVYICFINFIFTFSLIGYLVCLFAYLFINLAMSLLFRNALTYQFTK